MWHANLVCFCWFWRWSKELSQGRCAASWSWKRHGNRSHPGLIGRNTGLFRPWFHPGAIWVSLKLQKCETINQLRLDHCLCPFAMEAAESWCSEHSESPPPGATGWAAQTLTNFGGPPHPPDICFNSFICLQKLDSCVKLKEEIARQRQEEQEKTDHTYPRAFPRYWSESPRHWRLIEFNVSHACIFIFGSLLKQY